MTPERTLQGETVLVTGAGGFIGSHLCEALVQKGARVRALVKYNSRSDWGNLEALRPKVLESLDIITGDITDPFFVRQAARDCHTVFHLAALIGIPYSYQAPQHYVNVNVQGTLNVLEACRAEGVGKLVHTSTSEVYGTARYTPIDENHPLQGQSPYSASKIGADKLVESYYAAFDLPVTTVRPFNTYGPRQSARAVIPAIISQALAGDVVRVGSLAPQRDFTYVADTVAGFLRMAECPNNLGEVINLGTGVAVSIETVLQEILTLVGRPDLPVVTETQRIRPEKSEVGLLLSDNQKAKTLLGWEPTYTLQAGLAETLDALRLSLSAYKTQRYAI